MDVRQGSRALSRVAEALEELPGLPEAYAEAMLSEAVQTAHGRPTPQARMAADAMGVRGASITVLTGGAPAAVSAGSEWGSDIYTQFGPRREGGYWLMPAAESASVLDAGDRYLEQIMDRAIRGF